MYNIIEKKQNNKSLYTVVYSYGGLSLPLMQSRDHKDCINYILTQPEETKKYDKVKAKKSLHKCLSEMYNNRNKGK